MKSLSRLGLALLADMYTSPDSRQSVTVQAAPLTGFEPLTELRSILPYLSADDGRGNGSIDLAGNDNWLGNIWAMIHTYGTVRISVCGRA